MPEYPDITVYLERLEPRVVGKPLEKLLIASPFLLRTFDPPAQALVGKKVERLRRMGKRIVLGFDDDLFLVIHLMIAGRLHWREKAGKGGLAALHFPGGVLVLTEAGTKRRASFHIVRGDKELMKLDPGGLEVFDADLRTFKTTLLREIHTLKRTLTDPTIFSAIGNAYSDEILHRAKLSPLKRIDKMSDGEIRRLFDAIRAVLTEWTQRIREETGDGFPEHVTAFREGMAVHGRYRKPCPVCGSPIQRIQYAENETNYCPTCQTEGKLLADRSLSRLLKNDWPRRLEELEEKHGGISK